MKFEWPILYFSYIVTEIKFKKFLNSLMTASTFSGVAASFATLSRIRWHRCPVRHRVLISPGVQKWRAVSLAAFKTSRHLKIYENFASFIVRPRPKWTWNEEMHKNEKDINAIWRPYFCIYEDIYACTDYKNFLLSALLQYIWNFFEAKWKCLKFIILFWTYFSITDGKQGGVLWSGIGSVRHDGVTWKKVAQHIYNNEYVFLYCRGTQELYFFWQSLQVNDMLAGRTRNKQKPVNFNQYYIASSLQN